MAHDRGGQIPIQTPGLHSEFQKSQSYIVRKKKRLRLGSICILGQLCESAEADSSPMGPLTRLKDVWTFAELWPQELTFLFGFLGSRTNTVFQKGA